MPLAASLAAAAGLRFRFASSLVASAMTVASKKRWIKSAATAIDWERGRQRCYTLVVTEWLCLVWKSDYTTKVV